MERIYIYIVYIPPKNEQISDAFPRRCVPDKFVKK